MWLFSSIPQLCRGTDISKCLKETLGIRDNENRLYFHLIFVCLFVVVAVAVFCSFFNTVLGFSYLVAFGL